MAESAEELYRRAHQAADAEGRLAMPPVEEWDTFPFDGPIRVRPLQPPAPEPPRAGEDAADCWRCARGDKGAIWRDARWRLVPFREPSGLPVVVILEPRDHLDLPDLSEELSAELGSLIVRVERAVRRVENIGRVHLGRWGEGSAHLHVWFLGRTARLLQLRSSFAAIWDDILPPAPKEIWLRDLETVALSLAEGGGSAEI